MVTIKSYTSIEQSRKLAEILSFESADMYWKNGISNKYIQCFTPFVSDEYRSDVDYDYDVPCWSLAALLSLIPQEIFDGEYIINITEGIDNKWVITYDHHENRNHSYYGLSSGADNLVDACTDIIIKLKERNII